MKWINILRKAVNTAWKVSKYEVFSGPHSNWITPYLPVFSPNKWKYGAEKTPYLDTFHSEKLSLSGCFVIWNISKLWWFSATLPEMNTINGIFQGFRHHCDWFPQRMIFFPQRVSFCFQQHVFSWLGIWEWYFIWVFFYPVPWIHLCQLIQNEIRILVHYLNWVYLFLFLAEI